MESLTDTPEPLSARELEILHLLDAGLADREIAYRLVLALSTIKWYNREIYTKLGVRSRTQAVKQARQLGLLDSSNVQEKNSQSKHNLPAQTTPLIGRHFETGEVQKLLSTVRLLTLTGPPGTGKTRLALQVASIIQHEFIDGVFFVSLAPLTDATRIANTIAVALDIEEVLSEPLIKTLKRELHSKQLLLILDNFEHLLSEAAIISELLSSASNIKILITSRSLLNLYGETEYVVSSLSLPTITNDDSFTDLDCDAVSLFIQRAQAVNPGFEMNPSNGLDIAKICVRLNGLPLAIELAAARSKLLSPKILLERLSSRLEVLTSGARDLPIRQQTLRRTIDWSYDLLDDVEKTLFARLAVFSGGWSLEAAEKVCGVGLWIPILDGLTALVNQSLVQQYDTNYGERRFMILETIREYALEKFTTSEEAEAIRIAHADYFASFVAQTGRSLDTMGRSIGLSKLEIEQNNIRAVLDWSLASNPEPGFKLLAAVGMCWRIRSYAVEGLHWAQLLLAKGQQVRSELRALVLSNTGTLLACHLGEFAEADRMSQEALHIALATDDPFTLATAWFARSSALIEINIQSAQKTINNALQLFRKLEEPWELARTVNLKGEILRAQGHYKEAQKHYEEALILFRNLGNPWGVNIVLSNLAAVAHYQQRYDDALPLLTQALEVSIDLKDRASIAACLDGLAGVMGVMKQPNKAARLFGSAAAIRTSIGAHIQAGDRIDYERNVDFVRSQLDVSTFNTYWKEGHDMPLEQTIARYVVDSNGTAT